MNKRGKCCPVIAYIAIAALIEAPIHLWKFNKTTQKSLEWRLDDAAGVQLEATQSAHETSTPTVGSNQGTWPLLETTTGDLP